MRENIENSHRRRRIGLRLGAGLGIVMRKFSCFLSQGRQIMALTPCSFNERIGQ